MLAKDHTSPPLPPEYDEDQNTGIQYKRQNIRYCNKQKGSVELDQGLSIFWVKMTPELSLALISGRGGDEDAGSVYKYAKTGQKEKHGTCERAQRSQSCDEPSLDTHKNSFHPTLLCLIAEALRKKTSFAYVITFWLEGSGCSTNLNVGKIFLPQALKKKKKSNPSPQEKAMLPCLPQPRT